MKRLRCKENGLFCKRDRVKRNTFRYFLGYEGTIFKISKDYQKEDEEDFKSFKEEVEKYFPQFTFIEEWE